MNYINLLSILESKNNLSDDLFNKYLEYLNINLENNENYSIEVINVLGEIIMLKEVNSNSTIDLSEFGKGTYLVKVSNSELSTTERIVVE